MLTHVEFRSTEFPAYDSEAEEVNPGRFGKRLAEYLAEGLRQASETVDEPIPEDWGWVIPIENHDFDLWVGVGNYDEHEDGFLCFIEPHTEKVRKLFRKIPAKERIVQLQQRIDSLLQSHDGIRDVKWWTHEEFNHPAT